jgi:release factor glutamine methyltransferase
MTAAPRSGPPDIPNNPIVAPGTQGNVAVALATRWLREMGVADPARDARILLAEALSIPFGRLATRLLDPLAPREAQRYDVLLKRRMRREPVSQILGRRHFMTRSFQVTADVLDPRPETETLIRLAQAEPFARVLDLGTGSGAILCTLLADARGIATGVGVDTSEEVCQIAYNNATACGVLAAADIFISDWFEWVEGRFDLIVTNPPYISMAEFETLEPEVRDWEPRFALTDGGDGLGAYRLIARDLPGYLEPGGRFLCEIGPTQAQAVADLLRAAGLTGIEIHPDLDGRDRVVLARMPA